METHIKRVRKGWSKDEDALLIAEYLIKGARHCAKVLDRTVSSIHHRTERLRIMKPRYQFDVSAFETVTEPHVAYIMGLIWADGHLRKDGGGLVISLVKTDMDEVAALFYRTGQWSQSLIPIYERSAQVSMRLKAHHAPLSRLFARLGYRDKSVASPDLVLDHIPTHLRHYWWRGYFDGDGNLFVHQQRTRYGFVTIASSYDQDWTRHGIDFDGLGIRYTISRSINRLGHRGSYLKISNIDGVERFMRYIYQGYDSDRMGLSRKHTKWLTFESKPLARQLHRYPGVFKRDDYWRCIYRGKEGSRSKTEDEARTKWLVMQAADIDA